MDFYHNFYNVIKYNYLFKAYFDQDAWAYIYMKKKTLDNANITDDATKYYWVSYLELKS